MSCRFSRSAKGAGADCAGGRDLAQQVATFPIGFLISFPGKLAGKIADDDHVIMGCLANCCKGHLAAKHPDCDHMNTGVWGG